MQIMQMKSKVYHKLTLIFLVVILVQASCVQQPPTQTAPLINDKEKEEMLLRVNKYLVQKDEDIDPLDLIRKRKKS